MPDDEQAILEKIAQAEAALEKARRRASSADAKAAGRRQRLQQAEAAGDRRAAGDAKEPLARAEEEQEKADERVAKLQQELEDLRAALAAATADPADSIRLLEPEQPVALLPVRLETRFVTRTGAPGTDLLVRIYPDDVHSSSHEPELTQDEIDWGKSFASEMNKAAGDRDAEQRAWQKLSGRFGPRRAAWVAALMYPIDETGAPTGQSPSYVKRSRAWTRAPRAEALPDRWVVLGYQGGTRVLTEWADAPVSEPLAVGPDPAATVADPGDEALALDDGMRWMVEFDEAVKRGMAAADPADRAAGPGLRSVDGGGRPLVGRARRGSRPSGCAASGAPVHGRRRARAARHGHQQHARGAPGRHRARPVRGGQLRARRRPVTRHRRHRRRIARRGARAAGPGARAGGRRGRPRADRRDGDERGALARDLGLLPRPDDGRDVRRGGDRGGARPLRRPRARARPAAAVARGRPALRRAARDLARPLGAGRGRADRRPDGDRAAQASRALARLARRGASGRARQ